jgi:hypothetical protein
VRLRYLPPVRSPLTLGAVLAGVAPANGAVASVGSRVSQEYGARELLLTDSGTSALRLAIEAACGHDAGAVVALPAWCCYDVATAVDGAGVRAVLYDLDPRTLSPDPDSLDRALAAGASAVVVAHLYGIPTDLEEVSRAADRSGALVIEDAAQGVGASYRSRPLGSHGSLGVLSFGRGKGRTGGHGGALLANDPRGARALESVRSVPAPAGGSIAAAAVLLAQWALARPGWYRLPASLPFLGLGETVYRQPEPPGALSTRAAATLGVTWSLALREAESRAENALRIAAMLVGRRHIQGLQFRAGAVAGFLRYPALLPSADIDIRGRELGIARGYPLSLADLEGFGSRTLNPGEAFTGARELARRLCTFPTHSWVRASDIEAMGRWLEKRFPD